MILDAVLLLLSSKQTWWTSTFYCWSSLWINLFEMHCFAEISLKKKKGEKKKKRFESVVFKVLCFVALLSQPQNPFWVPTQKLPAIIFPRRFSALGRRLCKRERVLRRRSQMPAVSLYWAITSHKHTTGNCQVKCFCCRWTMFSHPPHNIDTFIGLWWIKVMIKSMSPRYFNI